MSLVHVHISNVATEWIVPHGVTEATFEVYQPGAGGAINLDGGDGGGGGGYARWEAIAVTEGDTWQIDPAEGGEGGDDAGQGFVYNSTQSTYVYNSADDVQRPLGGNSGLPLGGDIGNVDSGSGVPTERIAGGNGGNGPNGSAGAGAGSTSGPDGNDYSESPYQFANGGAGGVGNGGQLGIVIITYDLPSETGDVYVENIDIPVGELIFPLAFRIWSARGPGNFDGGGGGGYVEGTIPDDGGANYITLVFTPASPPTAGSVEIRYTDGPNSGDGVVVSEGEDGEYVTGAAGGALQSDDLTWVTLSYVGGDGGIGDDNLGNPPASWGGGGGGGAGSTADGTSGTFSPTGGAGGAPENFDGENGTTGVSAEGGDGGGHYVSYIILGEGGGPPDPDPEDDVGCHDETFGGYRIPVGNLVFPVTFTIWTRYGLGAAGPDGGGGGGGAYLSGTIPSVDGGTTHLHVWFEDGKVYIQEWNGSDTGGISFPRGGHGTTSGFGGDAGGVGFTTDFSWEDVVHIGGNGDFGGGGNGGGGGGGGGSTGDGTAASGTTGGAGGSTENYDGENGEIGGGESGGDGGGVALSEICITNYVEDPSLTIYDGLVFHYSLCQTMIDDVNGYNLTNNGGAINIAGIGPYPKSFSLTAGSSQKLSVADNVDISHGTGKSMTIMTWFRTPTLVDWSGILTQWNNGDGARQAWSLYLNNGQQLNIASYDVSSSFVGLVGSTLSTNTTYLICVQLDTDEGYLKIFVNNTFINSTTMANMKDTAVDFTIGANEDGGYTTGIFGQTVRWDRILTDDEMDYMYNSAAGVKLFPEHAVAGLSQNRRNAMMST